MKHKKIPFSKLVVALAVFLASGFIVFCCVEMHRQNDLSPISAIGEKTIGMLSVVIAAYMWRAKQADLYDMEIRKTQILGKKHDVPRVPDEDEESDYDAGGDEP